MNTNIFRSMSYGVYVTATMDKDRPTGCITNSIMQITSSPKKFSEYFHFYRKHKDKFDRASKKYQLFTLYQIRNKRMTWRTLLTLLSVRNGKRLADGIRGR